ncbi:MAG: carbohydrate kinase family protein [Gaiellaceae bacterium]
MTAPPSRAVVAGHVCLDVIPDVGSFAAGEFYDAFRPGHLLEVGRATISTGGAVSNTGLALHILGIPTQLVCKVGADPFGRIVRELISARDPSLAAGIVEDAGSSTSYSVVVSPPGVDRIFLHHPGANDSFDEGDVDLELVRRAALFHFGYPPIMRRMYEQGGRGLTEVLRSAKETGVTTSLDMSYPDPSSSGGRVDWRPILASSLPYVDLFLPSIEELLLMLRRPLFEELSARGPLLGSVTAALLHELGDELLAAGVSVLVVKLGERGLYLRSAERRKLADLGRATPSDPAAWGGRELWAPCFSVSVAGTAGSGDTTIAGFLAALLRGLGPEQALTSAVAVGACNVEAPDALSGLRGWEETMERIRGGWPRSPLTVDAPGWEWDETHELWNGDRGGLA